ncbi:hypothetical protein [Succinimonas amylolytica]|uniref:hypothetical protein n=1 Tax=Succinimonas amylolytica TaxID=83769 RepID=UPI0012F94EEF|nr:hypothetical protein [Succinimonas amylolytica]
MKNYIKQVCCLFVVMLLLGMEKPVLSETDAVYHLEGNGKDEKAAIGNLKMAALRENIKNKISDDDIRIFARILRTDIFMNVDELVAVDESSLDMTQNNGRYTVKGKVKVKDDAVMAKLVQIPDLNERIKLSLPEESETNQHTDDKSEKKDNIILAITRDDFMELVASSDAGNSDSIIQALKNGMNPDSRYETDDGQPYGDPAFCVYLENGNRDLNVVKAFISSGVNVLSSDQNGYHRTLFQVFNSNDDILKIILDTVKPSLKDIRFENKGTPLTEFLKNRDNADSVTSDLLDKIVMLGGDLNSANNEGISAVNYAIVNGKLEILKLLIEKGGDLKKSIESPMPSLYGDESKTVYQNIVDNDYSDPDMSAMKDFLISNVGNK